MFSSCDVRMHYYCCRGLTTIWTNFFFLLLCMSLSNCVLVAWLKLSSIYEWLVKWDAHTNTKLIYTQCCHCRMIKAKQSPATCRYILCFRFIFSECDEHDFKLSSCYAFNLWLWTGFIPPGLYSLSFFLFYRSFLSVLRILFILSQTN